MAFIVILIEKIKKKWVLGYFAITVVLKVGDWVFFYHTWFLKRVLGYLSVVIAAIIINLVLDRNVAKSANP